jgi:hypothetical protein
MLFKLWKQPLAYPVEAMYSLQTTELGGPEQRVRVTDENRLEPCQMKVLLICANRVQRLLE